MAYGRGAIRYEGRRRGNGAVPASAYGRRLLAVEPYGIEPVPAEERHGAATGQFTLWLGANLTIADFALGFLPIALGLPWAWTIAALVVGNALGALVLGLCATMGPSYHRPQLVIGRFSFGWLGEGVPAVFNYLSTLGWFAVNTILAAFGLRILAPALAFWQAALILVIAQGLLAVFGHNLIHAYERAIALALGLLFAATTALALDRGGALAGPAAAPAHVWPLFAVTVGAAYGYVGSWSPYASDYSRYLPLDTSRRRIGGLSFAGAFLASLWLELVGAMVAVLAHGQGNPIAALDSVMGGFGAIAVVAVILGGTAANALNLYSNALTAGALGLNLRRWLLALLASGLGLLASLLGSGHFESNYESFLLTLGYWFTPWAAVLLVDFFLRGGARRAGSDARHRRPVGWAALVSFALGIGCSVPFMAGPYYTGPLAADLGGAELSYYVGFLVAAVAYALLAREPERSTG